MNNKFWNTVMDILLVVLVVIVILFASIAIVKFANAEEKQDARPWTGIGMYIQENYLEPETFVFYTEPSYESKVYSVETLTFNKMLEMEIFRVVVINDVEWWNVIYYINGNRIHADLDIAWLPAREYIIDDRLEPFRDIYYMNQGDELVVDANSSRTLFVTTKKTDVYSNLDLFDGVERTGFLPKGTYLIPYLATKDQLWTNFGVVNKSDIREVYSKERTKLFGYVDPYGN